MLLEVVWPLKSIMIQVITLRKKRPKARGPLIADTIQHSADMLAIMIDMAKLDGQIEGVIPHFVDNGLSILQYSDDTIFLWNMT